VYTPGTNTWARKADLPGPAFDGAQGVIGGQLYVYTPVRGAGNFWRYDPATNKWATLPVPRTVHDFPVAGVIGGKFYLAGGTDAESAAQADVEAYDPATRTWTTKAPLPWSTSGVTGGVINGKLYAVASDPNKAAVYNPSTNTWTSIAPIPTAREAAVGAVAGGKLYIIGGGTGSSRATKIVQAYTP
jgi:N-acetylneuraminic acid mutarotase